METQGTLLKITVRLILATLIILIMVVGKEFLVPFTWSLLIALSSVRLIDWMQKKTGMLRGAVIALYLVFILFVLFSLGYFFYFELHNIFNDLPAILEQISDKLHSLSITLQSMGIAIPDHIDKSYISDWVHQHKEIINNFVSAFGFNIWNIILIMFYLFFLLYYKDLVSHFFTSHIKDKRKLVTARNYIEKSLTITRSYIYGLLMLTIFSSILNLIVFLIFGMKFALFFAVFLAILNLIPFIGNPIGLTIIMIFALITHDTFFVPLLMFVALFLSNFIQDNVIKPMLIGDKLQMNAFSVFVAIIIGSMIWGVSGMILFIPLVGIAKIFLEGQEENKSYAIFFSELPKSPKEKQTGKKSLLSKLFGSKK
jgi:predicted PurR-regulated permease PerM